MQYKIQELLPNIGKNFWVDALLQKLESGKKYVISDLRFVHEYEHLKKLNAFIIKITRQENHNIDTHCSEEEYKKFNCDLCLVNDSTIQNLLEKFDIEMS